MVSAAEPPMTTAELARHLGISTWRIPQDKLPTTYRVTLYHVRDGALTREYMTGDFTKAGDLLICTRWLSESVSVSVDDGNTLFSAKVVLPSKPVFATANHFTALKSPLLLCSAEPSEGSDVAGHRMPSIAAAPIDYTHVKNGLAIVVSSMGR